MQSISALNEAGTAPTTMHLMIMTGSRIVETNALMPFTLIEEFEESLWRRIMDLHIKGIF